MGSSPAPEFMPLAIGMGAAMVFGTWVAKRTIERVPPERFRQGVTALLVAAAIYLLVRG